MFTSFIKDPDANLDYSINWSPWLSGDTITTSTWEVPSGLTSGTELKGATATTIWLSGGTVGESYTLTNHIITAAGRADDRSIIIKIKQR